MPVDVTEKAKPSEVIAYFGKDSQGNLVTGRDIIGFKKADPDGYDAIARGIKDGTLTYG
jgi:hypothetical protein